MNNQKCAICGHELVVNHDGSFQCQCSGCGVRTAERGTEAKAIARWNETMNEVKAGKYPETVAEFKAKIK